MWETGQRDISYLMIVRFSWWEQQYLLFFRAKKFLLSADGRYFFYRCYRAKLIFAGKEDVLAGFTGFQPFNAFRSRQACLRVVVNLLSITSLRSSLPQGRYTLTKIGSAKVENITQLGLGAVIRADTIIGCHLVN